MSLFSQKERDVASAYGDQVLEYRDNRVLLKESANRVLSGLTLADGISVQSAGIIGTFAPYPTSHFVFPEIFCTVTQKHTLPIADNETQKLTPTEEEFNYWRQSAAYTKKSTCAMVQEKKGKCKCLVETIGYLLRQKLVSLSN